MGQTTLLICAEAVVVQGGWTRPVVVVVVVVVVAAASVGTHSLLPADEQEPGLPVRLHRHHPEALAQLRQDRRPGR